MSRQAIDSVARILGAVPSLIEKGDYTQAFEKAEKAQKLAEKAKVPDLINCTKSRKKLLKKPSPQMQSSLKKNPKMFFTSRTEP